MAGNPLVEGVFVELGKASHFHERDASLRNHTIQCMRGKARIVRHLLDIEQPPGHLVSLMDILIQGRSHRFTETTTVFRLNSNSDFGFPNR